MQPTTYHLLGRTGLRVSRLSLGTMTFGTENGWGCDRETARAMFDTYLASGGNFIDSADIYTQGTAETWLGEFMSETGMRDRVVLATKYSFNHQNPQGNPNAAGNGRKNLIRSLDASLARLKTDYVDLYYLHAWDGITPAEEVLRSMDQLVRAGKIRHWALSDVPAWYAARITTLAQYHGLEGPCAVQLEYSLVQRGIEYEFPAMCQEVGLGLVAWSPLGGGLLSGKYQPNVEAQAQQAGRIRATAAVATPALNKLTPRNWEIVAALESVANELGQPMARVAINWLSGRPALSSVILGATRLEQLQDSLGALDFELPSELRTRLDQVSALPPLFPYNFLSAIQPRMHGGASVSPHPPHFDEPPAARSGGWR
ncbi:MULTISPECIES: aldo/keto reductase [Comamonadaceae]|nr:MULTISPECIES: aldo/keto reductase [Comamonadaceae]KZT16685.1 aldo/keto reductase [Acidovorax sp. GW101-3H11]MBO0941465.1 aldo/keto reductase [Acidovorax temperans]MBP6760164.1 aldo/keto reductase [Thauera sp.]